ncbi:MAG: 16S rRNA (uracil(1498)-N(3))-methyltransferase [Desulfobulbaceae bacterium]|nr:16S rRNA (uracil(1498)-N(3))-methyltransferase [Desulfobulbaceae bacterium]
MRRFFINPAQIQEDIALITDQEARHISMALRLKPGNVIELFDGEGMIYQAEIAAIDKFRVTTKIVSRQHHQDEAPFLAVAQALIKGSKMDLIIQKATELGVSDLWPTINRHCAITSASSSQICRWQRISQESCKQCDRPTPMIVHAATPLPQLLGQTKEFSTKILLWESETTKSLHDIDLQSSERTLLLIGPEGGFSTQEADSAIDHGFLPVSLGTRMLRAETAAITGISIVQFLLGNLRRKPQEDSAAQRPALPKEAQ